MEREERSDLPAHVQDRSGGCGDGRRGGGGLGPGRVQIVGGGMPHLVG